MTHDVVIVGSGAAGIGAARRLAGSGLSVLVFEAAARLGGRAHTETLEGMPLDFGCGWLHSGERNPWTSIAEESGFAVDRTQSAWLRQYRELGFSQMEQQAAHESRLAWRERLEHAAPASDRASDALPQGGEWNTPPQGGEWNTPPRSGEWNNLLQAISGFANGAALEHVSIADYLAYDRASSENNWRVPAGYGTLIAASVPAVPVRLSMPVTAIDHSAGGLRIETRDGAISARTAILTVSTAVLASGAIRFHPALDDRLHAASCLPLGLANKLFLAIEGAAPLAAETHVIGNPRLAETGSYYIRPFGRPVVECFYGGPGAMALEKAGLDETFAFAMDELSALFGSGIRRFLTILAGSAWGQAEWIGGSYSHARPGEAKRRAELAAPVDNRLFFAGEATHPTDFSTAHGAYLTGVRAADEAMAALGAK